MPKRKLAIIGFPVSPSVSLPFKVCLKMYSYMMDWACKMHFQSRREPEGSQTRGWLVLVISNDLDSISPRHTYAIFTSHSADPMLLVLSPYSGMACRIVSVVAEDRTGRETRQGGAARQIVRNPTATQRAMYEVRRGPKNCGTPR